MSLYTAILRTVMREARAKGWRPLQPRLRSVSRLYQWVDAEERIIVRIEPSPKLGYGMMQMTIRQHMYCGWVDIDVSQIGAWQYAIDTLAERHIIDPMHAAAWRRGQGAATDTIPRGTGEMAKRFLARLGVEPDARPVTVLAAVRRHLRDHVYAPYAADLPARTTGSHPADRQPSTD